MKILGIGSRIEHSVHGKGVITNVTNTLYWVTFIESGIETIPLDADMEVIEAIDGELDTVSFSEVEQSLVSILRKWSDASSVTPIAEKWKKGTLILQPGDANLSSKEIPIDTFFHKIVMVRDRLRVMEQRINSSKLTDEGKVNLQQYITRIYGSLTSFNVLFKYKEDHFRGDGGK